MNPLLRPYKNFIKRNSSEYRPDNRLLIPIIRYYNKYPIITTNLSYVNNTPYPLYSHLENHFHNLAISPVAERKAILFYCLVHEYLFPTSIVKQEPTALYQYCFFKPTLKGLWLLFINKDNYASSPYST